MTLSPSQKALRVIIAAASVGLALLTALGTPQGSLVAAAVLLIPTAFVALDPATRLTTLLLGLHAVNWLSSTVFPTQMRDWVLTIIAAVVLLTIHLAAALATALPDAAPIPRASLIRWVRRGLTVVGLSVPLWALLIGQSASSAPAVPVITYAAVASLAILALAFWLTQVQTQPKGPAPSAPDQRPR